MKSTIWKFPLEAVDEQTIDIPRGGRVLSVAVQRGAIVVYALVDPKAPIEKRVVRIHGTGHSCDLDGFRFVGTVLLRNDALVLHVFVIDN
jgi:hypothetical protein